MCVKGPSANIICLQNVIRTNVGRPYHESMVANETLHPARLTSRGVQQVSRIAPTPRRPHRFGDKGYRLQ